MAEENIDAIMFFVGEGRFTLKSGASDTVGFVKGESQDTRFGKDAGDAKGDPRTQRYGSFAINQFQWRSGQESLSMDDALDDEDDDRGLNDDDEPSRRRRSRTTSFHPPPSRDNMRPKVGCFTVQKEVDIATPTLFLANATGAKFPECHIYFRKSGGTELFTYLHLAFTDVVILEWNTGVNDRKSDETIVVKFDWCQISYYPQTKSGDRKKEHANIKQFCTTDSENKTPPAGLKEPTRR